MKLKRIHLWKNPPISYIYFGLLLLMGIWCYVSPGRLIIRIFMVALLTCVLDGLYFWSVKNKLRLHISGSKAIEKNDTAHIRVKIVNKASLPSPILTLKFNETHQLQLVNETQAVFFLAPKEKADYEIEYKARLSGESFVGIETGILRSFLGFFCVKMPLELYIKANILPELCKLQGIQTLLENMDSQENGEEEIGQAGYRGEEVGYELRPYAEGDSQKLIHWKIAAQKDIYVVRDWEEALEKARNILLVLSPFIEGIEDQQQAILQDKTMSAMVSAAYEMVLHGQSVKAACYIRRQWKTIELRQPVQIRELQELLSAYRAMPAMPSAEKVQLTQSMIKQLKKHNGSSILVSGCWDPQLQELLQENDQEIEMIWTGSGDEAVKGSSKIRLWQLTDSYKLQRIG